MTKKIRMGTLSEIPPGGMLEKRIFSRRVAVVNDNGRLFGIESECKHMKASLAKGKIVDGVVTCPWHGWKYELGTGRCLTVEKFVLKRYEIEVHENEVFLILS